MNIIKSEIEKINYCLMKIYNKEIINILNKYDVETDIVNNLSEINPRLEISKTMLNFSIILIWGDLTSRKNMFDLKEIVASRIGHKKKELTLKEKENLTLGLLDYLEQRELLELFCRLLHEMLEERDYSLEEIDYEDYMNNILSLFKVVTSLKILKDNISEIKKLQDENNRRKLIICIYLINKISNLKDIERELAKRVLLKKGRMYGGNFNKIDKECFLELVVDYTREYGPL